MVWKRAALFKKKKYLGLLRLWMNRLSITVRLTSTNQIHNRTELHRQHTQSRRVKSLVTRKILQRRSLLFFQWETHSSSDLADDITAPALTPPGAAINVLNDQLLLSLVITPETHLKLPVVPRRMLTWLNRRVFCRSSRPGKLLCHEMVTSSSQNQIKIFTYKMCDHHF